MFNSDSDEELVRIMEQEMLEDDLDRAIEEENHCSVCGLYIEDIFAVPIEGKFYCEFCYDEKFGAEED